MMHMRKRGTRRLVYRKHELEPRNIKEELNLLVDVLVFISYAVLTVERVTVWNKTSQTISTDTD